MLDSEHKYTCTRRRRWASYAKEARWVQEVWDAVGDSVVLKSFGKVGIIGSGSREDSGQEAEVYYNSDSVTSESHRLNLRVVTIKDM